jgi:four helix bundle protein
MGTGRRDHSDRIGTTPGTHGNESINTICRDNKTLYNYVLNNLRDRAKRFAVRAFHLIDKIPESAKGRVIQTQLAKAATSAAANYRAAQRSRSRAEFISKLSTTFEEIDESAFWLEFLVDTGLMTLPEVGELLGEADELSAIISASRKTARANAKSRSRP